MYFYIEFVYVFHHDTIKVVNASTLRRKSLACKVLLTILSLLLNIGFPMQEKPATFQWLTKGKNYDRYFFRLPFFDVLIMCQYCDLEEGIQDIIQTKGTKNVIQRGKALRDGSFFSSRGLNNIPYSRL